MSMSDVRYSSVAAAPSSASAASSSHSSFPSPAPYSYNPSLYAHHEQQLDAARQQARAARDECNLWKARFEQLEEQINEKKAAWLRVVVGRVDACTSVEAPSSSAATQTPACLNTPITSQVNTSRNTQTGVEHMEIVPLAHYSDQELIFITADILKAMQLIRDKQAAENERDKNKSVSTQVSSSSSLIPPVSSSPVVVLPLSSCCVASVVGVPPLVSCSPPSSPTYSVCESEIVREAHTQQLQCTYLHDTHLDDDEQIRLMEQSISAELLAQEDELSCLETEFVDVHASSHAQQHSSDQLTHINSSHTLTQQPSIGLGWDALESATNHTVEQSMLHMPPPLLSASTPSSHEQHSHSQQQQPFNHPNFNSLALSTQSSAFSSEHVGSTDISGSPLHSVCASPFASSLREMPRIVSSRGYTAVPIQKFLSHNEEKENPNDSLQLSIAAPPSSNKSIVPQLNSSSSSHLHPSWNPGESRESPALSPLNSQRLPEQPTTPAPNMSPTNKYLAAIANKHNTPAVPSHTSLSTTTFPRDYSKPSPLQAATSIPDYLPSPTAPARAFSFDVARSSQAGSNSPLLCLSDSSSSYVWPQPPSPHANHTPVNHFTLHKQHTQTHNTSNTSNKYQIDAISHSTSSFSSSSPSSSLTSYPIAPLPRVDSSASSNKYLQMAKALRNNSSVPSTT